MRQLILVEHHASKVHPATLSCITVAQSIGNEVDLLLMSDQCEALIEELKTYSGVNRILVAQAAHYKHLLAEDITQLIQSALQ